jgi:hypothetical protein
MRLAGRATTAFRMFCFGLVWLGFVLFGFLSEVHSCHDTPGDSERVCIVLLLLLLLLLL